MNKKILSLLIINLATLIFIFTKDPIVQDTSYHGFVDVRSFFGHPNFFDCLSNLPFLIFGIMGLKYSSQNYLSISWKFFFIGVILVAFGSYYYHFSPDNNTLVWDRLPMTIAFSSLVIAVLYDTFKLKAQGLSLLVMNLIGITSIIVWVQSGDLRLYYWVQLTPILSLLIIGLIFSKSLNGKYLVGAFTLYILAKLTEHSDALFYDAIGFSGHTIKHLLAALAIYCLYLMKKKQKKPSLS